MGWFRADLAGSRIVFTDRHGGVSGPPFSTLNLSDAGGDAPDAVARNRVRVGEVLGADPGTWVPIRQVHGTDVVVCASEVPAPTEADAVVLTAEGPSALIVTADCAAVAVVGAGGAAALHGGWRGLRDGVVGSALDAFRSAVGEPLLAVLGPCIRRCCYEFGAGDLEAMVERFGDAVAATTAAGRPALDVPGVVRRALEEQGLSRLLDLGICTSCSPDYFSYRREGTTGRQGLLVTRTER